MTKGTAKLTPNYWFSQLAFVVSIIALMTMTLITYIHFSDETTPYRDEAFVCYIYLFYALGVLLLAMTGSAYYLRKQLQLLPFIGCLSLVGCFTIVAIINQLNIEPVWQPFALFTQLLLSLLLISGTWWLTVLTPPLQFALIYYNNKKYRFWGWLGLILVYLEIGLEFWVRSHYALFCNGPTLCDWQMFTDLDLNSIFKFWITHQIANADLPTQFRIFYHTLMFMILSYFSLLSLVLVFSKYLSRFGIFNFFLIAIKIAISFSNSEWLIKMVDYGLLLLLLLSTIAFLSNLYPKLQSTGWAYQPVR